MSKTCSIHCACCHIGYYSMSPATLLDSLCRSQSSIGENIHSTNTLLSLNAPTRVINPACYFFCTGSSAKSQCIKLWKLKKQDSYRLYTDFKADWVVQVLSDVLLAHLICGMRTHLQLLILLSFNLISNKLWFYVVFYILLPLAANL